LNGSYEGFDPPFSPFWSGSLKETAIIKNLPLLALGVMKKDLPRWLPSHLVMMPFRSRSSKSVDRLRLQTGKLSWKNPRIGGSPKVSELEFEVGKCWNHLHGIHSNLGRVTT